MRLIGESSIDTQLIPTHIYLHLHTLVLASITPTPKDPTAISIDIFTSGVIQVNDFKYCKHAAVGVTYQELLSDNHHDLYRIIFIEYHPQLT